MSKVTAYDQLTSIDPTDILYVVREDSPGVFSSNYTRLSDLLTSNVADGGSAVAHTLDTANALSTSGAKLLSLQNASVEKFYIEHDGTVAVPKINFTDTNNTLIGNSAGAALTSGNTNMFAGDQAGLAVTTGVRNTGIGPQAFRRVTGGVDNTAVGYRAMGVTGTGTSASYNVAIGASALYTTSGSHNVAIGRNSLDSLTGGSFNIGIGSSAIHQTTASQYTTAIGYNSGGNSTTLSNCVLLGAYAGQYELGSHAFYVNNQNRSNTTNEKESSLLYGTFDADRDLQTLAINAVRTSMTPDGAGEVGFDYNTANTLSDSTALIARWQNNGTSILEMFAGGKITRPTGSGIDLHFQTGNQNTQKIIFEPGGGTVQWAFYRSSQMNPNAPGGGGASAFTTANITSTMIIGPKSRTSGSGGVGDLYFLGAYTNEAAARGGSIYLRAGLGAGAGGTDGNIILDTLPTSDPGITGALWNDAGTLKIS